MLSWTLSKIAFLQTERELQRKWVDATLNRSIFVGLRFWDRLFYTQRPNVLIKQIEIKVEDRSNFGWSRETEEDRIGEWKGAIKARRFADSNDPELRVNFCLLLAGKIYRCARAGTTLRLVSRNVPETMDREGATSGFTIWWQWERLVRACSGQDDLHFLLLDTVAR